MSGELTMGSAPTGGVNDDLSKVSSLKSASQLLAKVQQVKRARTKIEREWRLNLAFFKGNQWVFHNRFSNRIESLPVEDGDKPRYRVRLVSNQILPGVQGYIAMLTKTKPVIYATPDGAADNDVKAAQTATRLFEYWWSQFKMKSKLQEALAWSAIGAAGYWQISYDPQAGSAMQITTDPSGKPIMDEELRQAFLNELRDAGVDPAQFQKTIYMGDIRVDVVSPFNVYVDPTASSFEDAKWVIVKKPMAPDEIKARWGVDVKPDAVPSGPDVALPFMNSEDKTDPTVKNVYHGYFKPQPALPKGRYVCFIDDPKKILVDEPWNLPTHELPFVEFAGVDVPGSATNEALVTHARPLQKELNRTLSQIVEHKNLTVRPQMLAPAGSLRQRLTNEPGAIFEYNPVANQVPQWREMPQIPPYVFEHLREIQARLDRLFNLQAISRGDVPPNVEAGVAIDLLQEAAVDQLSPVIQQMEEALAAVGHQMVALAQKYYTEPRLLKIKGEGGSTQVRKFLNSDIQGAFSFHAEAGSGLPRTRAGRQARIESLIQMGVLRPDQAAKHLDIADLKGVYAQFQAAEDQAYREHEKIIKGAPVNPIAVQQAMQAVNQGMNPETHQPLTPNDNPQQLLQNAGLQPLPFENFQQHMDTHALFMQSSEYEALPLQIQQAFQTHFMQTLSYYRSLPVLPQPQAIRSTIQYKATIDPVTAAQALKRGGVIDADPTNLSQPPLDTWVTDDLTKEAAQQSGNTHIEAMQQLQTMEQAEEKHELDLQKSQVQTQLMQQKAAHEAQLTQMHAKHQDEMHQMKLATMAVSDDQKTRHADEMHQAKKKQAAKPKPTTNGG